MSNRISVKVNQTAVLLAIVLVARRVIIAPAVMFFAAGRDGYISYFFAFAINVCLIIAIAYTIKKNPGKSFSQVCKEYFGATFTKILLFILAVFFIYKALAIDYEMQNLLLESIYVSINWNLFIIPVLLVVCYLAGKGPRVMGRISIIFLPLILFVFLYTFIMCIPNADFSNLLPVLDKGTSPMFKGIFYGFSQTGEFLFLFMFMEHIADKSKKIVKYLTLSAVLTYIFVVFFYIMFVSIFGESGISLKEGIIRITQFYPSEASNFRIDGITSVCWIPSCVILSSVMIYSAGRAIQDIFNIKKIGVCVLVVVTIMMIVKFIPSLSSEQYLHFSLNVASFITPFIHILIPLMLFITTLIRKRKEKN